MKRAIRLIAGLAVICGLIVSPIRVGAASAFHGATTAQTLCCATGGQQGGALPSINIAVPAGAQNGDLLILVVPGYPSCPISVPAAFTQIATTGPSVNQPMTIYTRTANAEPASYTLSSLPCSATGPNPPALSWSVAMLAYAGTLDDVNLPSTCNCQTNSTFVGQPVTATENGETIVGIYTATYPGIQNAGYHYTVTGPANQTSRVNFDTTGYNAGALAIGDFTANAGTVTPAAATGSNDHYFACCIAPTGDNTWWNSASISIITSNSTPAVQVAAPQPQQATISGVSAAESAPAVVPVPFTGGAG